MDDQTVEERLAALRARRGGAVPQQGSPPQPPPVAAYPASGFDSGDPDSIDGRLAALQARRQAPMAPQAAWEGDGYRQPSNDQTIRMDYDSQQPVLSLASEPMHRYNDAGSVSILEQLGLDRLRLDWSPSRFIAAGASVVSFGAMVVAMGPLLAEAGNTDTGTVEGADLSSQAAVPEAPDVQIELNNSGEGIDPGAVADPALDPATTGLLADDGSGGAIDPAVDSTAPLSSAGSETTVSSGSAAPTTAAGGTAAPTTTPATAAPTTAAPTTAGGGGATTAPPTTAAPTTPPPTTAPPTTAAPTTPPPTTAPPTTAPPTTQGSGG